MANEPTLIAAGDRWADAEQVKLAAVWLQFLLVSPSYELARKYRTEAISDADKLRLPVDFETVLAVYDDLGDVRRETFESWWLAKGIRYFGNQGQEPVALPVYALLSGSEDPSLGAAVQIKKFVDQRWTRQGRPNTLLVAIPVALSKVDILEQIANLIDGVPEEYVITTVIEPKYQIRGKKHDIESYFRYLKCLLIRAEFPKTKLWEIGVLADLSTTYSERIAKGDGTSEDQQALKILASRSLHRGLMMAENAARGIFPSYETCVNAVSPVWADLDALMAERFEWEDGQQ